MGLVANYVDGRINKKLEALNISVDPDDCVLFDEDFYKRLNKVFYKGDTAEIIRFFKTHRPKYSIFPLNSFYRVVTGNVPIMHYDLAGIITKTMVNLLFSDSPRFEALGDNQSLNEQNNEILEKIFKENKIGILLQKACEMESYSGAVGFKPVIDKDFSDFPILVPYPKEDIELIKKYDRVTEVMFKDYYEYNDKTYILYTICGKGYIDYKLYESSKKESKEVSLATLEETSDLKKLNFFNKQGEQLKTIMCVYKENKADAESDYKNIYDDFAALDEIYSNLIDFIRKSKIKTYYPETMLEQDAKTGKKLKKNEYDCSDVILHDSNPSGTTQEVKRDIVDVNNSLTGYREAFNNVLLNALSTAGLSPASVGLDMAGANSSALALNIRERVSLRTKAEKQKRWHESLIELVQLVLTLNSITSVDSENIYLEEFEDNVKITFPEYETPTFDEQVQSLSTALQSNLIDLESALKMLYPNKTEDEIELMMTQIEGQLPNEEDIVDKELESEDEEEPEKEEKEDK